MNFKPSNLKPDNYRKSDRKKTQIYLHHTAGPSSKSALDWWNMDGKAVSTMFILERDGTIIKNFDFDSWSHHLNIGTRANKINPIYKKNSKIIEEISVGIELVSWGGLTEKNGKFYTWNNSIVKPEDVTKLNYRGYKAFHKYPDAQIEGLKTLLVYLLDELNLDIKEDYSDIFDINERALNLEPGLYSHSSVRADKSDIFFQDSMLKMLNSLHG